MPLPGAQHVLLACRKTSIFREDRARRQAGALMHNSPLGATPGALSSQPGRRLPIVKQQGAEIKQSCWLQALQELPTFTLLSDVVRQQYSCT